ncbi:SURF1 family protein [Piscinibacter sakaiensis]|uniref:SURF1 family protein n=1 Tax=Piscinibacter sakaiensis TaxID=1547922 RepID=UPI003AAA9925
MNDRAPRSGGGARRWLILLAAIVAAAATARLGIWQLDRAAQKAALQQAIESRAAMPPLPQSALAATADDAAGQHQRLIRLTGRWLGDATVFLDNRQIDGRPGFFVLTPLQLQPPPANAAPPVWVWVQRGWVARDNNDRTRLPDVPTPEGPVELSGRIATPPARLFEFAAEESGPIRQNLDLDASARSLGGTVLPLTVLQTEASSGIDDGLVRRWPSPALGIDKHHGYAFQWFALSALIICLYVWFQLVRRWRPTKREEA